MIRAQFIVPLQYNYNQKVIIYGKIIGNTAHITFYNITKYYIQSTENIFELFSL